jgi:hypothetical protein
MLLGIVFESAPSTTPGRLRLEVRGIDPDAAVARLGAAARWWLGRRQRPGPRCVPSFNGCTATSSNGIASQAAGPGVANQIGITLTFTLSPGDSAGITSRFEIVPEPSTVLLGGMGLLGLWITGRRRS